MSIHRLANRAAAAAAALVGAGLVACAEPNASSPELAAASNRAGYAPGEGQRQYGAPVTLGAGKVRAYVVTDNRNGTPLELGVAIDARVLSSLPGDMTMLHLPLPPKAPAPYTFVMFDWNPDGHEPIGVYNLPHFDFHFYTAPEAEVAAITKTSPEGSNMPPQSVVPQYYGLPPMPPVTLEELIVPGMGIHWSDARSPELPGPNGPPTATFTKTFIYGSWNGRFTFLEPMITLAYLAKAVGTETIDIPQSTNMAATFQANGWYPRNYRIAYDAQNKEYRVAIAGLTESTR